MPSKADANAPVSKRDFFSDVIYLEHRTYYKETMSHENFVKELQQGIEKQKEKTQKFLEDTFFDLALEKLLEDL
uniref:SPX domain-containing protein n=1 Tax=Caenorhabditis tropicalis TaxID=1561998 RepID=A0A1I7SXD3_9PELO